MAARLVGTTAPLRAWFRLLRETLQPPESARSLGPFLGTRLPFTPPGSGAPVCQELAPLSAPGFRLSFPEAKTFARLVCETDMVRVSPT